MTPLIFVLTLATFTGTLLIWAFRFLPRERWQILATVPLRKTAAGTWEGVNLTYYGFFCAAACITGIALATLMLASINLPLSRIALLAGLLVAIGVTSAKLVARIVEKKRYTFTIGGAAFVGFIAMPGLITLLNMAAPDATPIPVLPALAAIMTSYTIAESVGRLACISFGCCYGKPLDNMPVWAKRLFNRVAFAFEGEMKKIAYESGQAGVRVFPIQGLTAVIYLVSGHIGLYLFLSEMFVASFLLATIVTMGWRFLSELLRADYRGAGNISSYQWMSLLMIAIAVVIAVLVPAGGSHPDLRTGLLVFSSPALILGLQALWVGLFFYFGWSKVTGAALAFHVKKDRV